MYVSGDKDLLSFCFQGLQRVHVVLNERVRFTWRQVFLAHIEVRQSALERTHNLLLQPFLQIANAPSIKFLLGAVEIRAALHVSMTGYQIDNFGCQTDL